MKTSHVIAGLKLNSDDYLFTLFVLAQFFKFFIWKADNYIIDYKDFIFF